MKMFQCAVIRCSHFWLATNSSFYCKGEASSVIGIYLCFAFWDQVKMLCIIIYYRNMTHVHFMVWTIPQLLYKTNASHGPVLICCRVKDATKPTGTCSRVLSVSWCAGLKQTMILWLMIFCVNVCLPPLPCFPPSARRHHFLIVLAAVCPLLSLWEQTCVVT